VGAAAPTVPQELLDQLAKPGRMFIPVGDGVQDVWQIDKDSEGGLEQRKLFGVRVRALLCNWFGLCSYQIY
jgi:protein-L-isoaspartate(D-aspartate) O-methyltransferase